MTKPVLLFIAIFLHTTLFSQNIDVEMNAVDSLIKLGKLAEAERQTKRILELDESCWRCNITMGQLQYDGKNYTQAIHHYTKALNKEERGFLYFLKADAHYANENMDQFCINNAKGLEIYNRVIDKLKPGDLERKKHQEFLNREVCNKDIPSYFIHRAIAAFNKGDTTTQLTYLNEGLKVFPKSPLLHNYRGHRHLLGGQNNKARADYNFVFNNKEGLVEYLKNHQSVNGDDEIQLYFAQIKMNMALTYSNQGEYSEGANIIEETLKDFPKVFKAEHAAILSFFGELKLNEGKLNRAEHAFQKAVQINGTLALAYRNLALIALHKQYNSENKQRIFSIHSNFKGLRTSTDIKLKNKGKNQKALESALYLINRAIKLDSEDNEAFWIRGDIKKLLGLSDYCLDYRSAMEKGKIGLEEYINQECN